jgi:hypothetical protein
LPLAFREYNLKTKGESFYGEVAGSWQQGSQEAKEEQEEVAQWRRRRLRTFAGACAPENL